MKILSVTPRENYQLEIMTDNGKFGLFDVRPYLNAEAFIPLQNMTAFCRVENGGYFVEWECGADLSVDTIAAHWQPIVLAA
ncbi:hypothetical protein CKO09_01410 [Chromatium weissei]|nr:hypothetical protein [Chromatium weissei]